MKHFPAITLAAALFASGAAWADSDCHQPMAQWQPREAVSAHVLERGITTDRLRIDDGCYEVRGRDSDGNPVELKLDPASLEIMEFEVHFRPGANTSRYLPGARNTPSKPATSVTPAAPVAPVTPTTATMN
ncbi:MAG: PepSY domain-containing protein [Comamonas sp.]|nr:PepSY domain-containing protein [Comamonas sp.]